MLLATGRGKRLEQATDADRAEARRWLEQARDHGNGEAASDIETLGDAKG